MRKLAICAAVSAALAPGMAFATNGMNMEGYGPVATAMGGASMAYDNGAAAMMNNPATLALMPEGSRLDAALGRMGPKVTSSAGGQNADSSATSFLMPAMGWVAKRGPLSFGAGVFAQGGMGTEYAGDSFMSAGSGKTTRSEVGVMRVMFPIAYEVNQKVSLGGSFDYVRASMDLQMAMSGAQMQDMMPFPGATQKYGTLSGSMINTLGGMMGPNPGQINSLNWGYFDFSDSGKFTGKAQASGFAGKFGGVYRVDSHLAIGAAYHSKTQMKDLEASGATVTMNVGVNGAPGPVAIPVTGKIMVRNFQWPETYAAGVAYRVTEPLTLVADYKRIQWSKVMKDFRMTFIADGTQSDPTAQGAGLGGKEIDATLYQNWNDQNVFQLGGAYTVNSNLVIRGGVNLANNPVPDTYMHPLFPAIVKNHFTGGAGYAFSKVSSLDASVTIAPQVSATNGQGVTSKHSQFNLQVMYSHRF